MVTAIRQKLIDDPKIFTMAISLGAVLGGPEPSAAIHIFRILAKKLPGQETPFLNVVFHFPGSLIEPDYAGLRTGRFSKKEPGFMIQAAVPDSIAKSNNPNEILDYFRQTILEALELSRDRWKKHGTNFPWETDHLALESCIRNCRAEIGGP